MKTQKNILIAFLLNLLFSIFEIIGGIFTGSVAITSDAVHDMGDAVSIGISYFLEKKSRKNPDNTYTYGYTRYSVIGSVITTLVLLFGSVMVVINAIEKIINKTEINYNGMLFFAIIGIVVNFLATYFTREGDSLNQKAVNLHMLEDVLGWAVVLVGTIVIKLTGFSLIDPLMSIGIAIFILINAVKNLKEALDLFLEKTPKNISIEDIKSHILNIDGVEDIHHIHIWSLDGHINFATMHVVASSDSRLIKEQIREELLEHGISHSTLEFEKIGECCVNKECKIEHNYEAHHHHHH